MIVNTRNHIHDIKFIRMFGMQNNCTVYPQNQTHSLKKCKTSLKSLFVEHDGTRFYIGAATFPVNIFTPAENLHKNIHLPFRRLTCSTWLIS